MYYRNISDLNSIILKRLSILPRDFDLIVGIPRSGMLPANLLALYLNRPYTDVDSFIGGRIYKAGVRGQFFDVKDFKKILVVDDSLGSGVTMDKCRESLKGAGSGFLISYCAIYVTPGREQAVDHYFEVVPLPRCFQWNIFHHVFLENACFDIDGVLCVDPTEEQNDDGEKYRDFILNAAPLLIPGCRVGTLVTSRLEKYRKETEIWLQKNNVKYDRLLMLDLPDKKARIRANNHAGHKAGIYSSKPYSLFVESSLSQAIEINMLSKKPVLCTENFEMIYDAESVLYNIRSGRWFPALRKYALKIRNRIRKMR